MGLSASQARLLSITTRISNNEMESMLLTNSKLRLADKNSIEKTNYLDALEATKFEYVADSATSTLGAPIVNASEAGIIRLVVTDPIKTTNAVTLQFKAIEDTEGAVFTASNFSTDKDEELTTTTATVKVVTETATEPENPGEETPTEPTTPATDNNEGTTTNNNTNADEKVGTNGQVITKLPQTGTPVFIGVVAVIALAGITLVVRKVRK